MSLEKIIKIDQIEIVGDYKAIQVRTATVVTDDGKELSRSFHRHVLHPNSDISGEDAEVQAICNAVWTDEVKAAYQTFLDSQTPLGGIEEVSEEASGESVEASVDASA